MKSKHVLLMVMGAMVSVSSFAAGNDVPKGALVVRYGAANTDVNYENQDGYPGKLQGVSALCSSEASTVDAAKVRALILTDRGHPNPLNKAGATNASTLINKNATVKKDPQPNNPNHCLINNIELKNIKGAWQIYSNPLN